MPYGIEKRAEGIVGTQRVPHALLRIRLFKLDSRPVLLLDFQNPERIVGQRRVTVGAGCVMGFEFDGVLDRDVRPAEGLFCGGTVLLCNLVETLQDFLRPYVPDPAVRPRGKLLLAFRRTLNVLSVAGFLRPLRWAS